MGKWGIGLYDNDITADVRDAFQGHIEKGLTPALSKQAVLAELSDIFCSQDEGTLAKLALCDQLWELGILLEEEKTFALSYIANGADLRTWEAISSEDAQKRKQILTALAEKFSSPMPVQCKKKRTAKSFDWKNGQLYALPLYSETADKLGLNQEYALLYFYSEYDIISGYRIPNVWTKITKNGILPHSAEQFNQLEYVQIACTEMGERFTPFKDEASLPEHFKQTYLADDWGFLPEFTMRIYESRNNHPPKDLILLGSFEGIKPPKYEYHRYRSAIGAAWIHLEEFILQCYCIHNLRQGLFYKDRV